MGSMQGEQLGKGGDGMDLRGGILLYRSGWRWGHQEGVDAEACQKNIDIERRSIGRGRGGDGGGEDGVFVAIAVVVLVLVNDEFTFLGSQGLVRLEGEVCPEVEVGREVGEGGSEVLGILLDGVDDVETTQVEGRHGGRGQATF